MRYRTPDQALTFLEGQQRRGNEHGLRVLGAIDAIPHFGPLPKPLLLRLQKVRPLTLLEGTRLDLMQQEEREALMAEAIRALVVPA